MRRFGGQTRWRGGHWFRRVDSTPESSSTRAAEPQEKLKSPLEASPPRAVRRFIPKQSVTVTINEDGFPLACGEVRDLSESGACVVTDLVLKRGWRIDLKVSLGALEGVIETRGQVVWSGEGSYGQDVPDGADGPTGQAAKGSVLGALHGVQFTGLSDEVRSRLKGLLTTNAFEMAPTTLGGAADRTPFQDMLEALQPELDRLGSKIE